jgi:ADP-heptose:LPS heptosyltransferase
MQDFKTKGVLFVRSAFIGDFIVVTPFIRDYCSQNKIRIEDCGFLIFNDAFVNPVNAIFPTVQQKNVMILRWSFVYFVKEFLVLHKFARQFSQIVYLPFVRENGLKMKLKQMFLMFIGGGGVSTNNYKKNKIGGLASQYAHLYDVYKIEPVSIHNNQQADSIAESDHAYNVVLKIAVYPNSKIEIKRWPIENYINLIKQLKKELSIEVYLIGSATDYVYNSRICAELKDLNINNIAGDFSISQAISKLKGFDLYIGNDGAPMHMAALANIPIIALFTGKEPVGTWAPIVASKYVTIQQATACTPCYKNTCSNNKCISSIDVEEVMNQVRQILFLKKANVRESKVISK